MDNCAYPSHPFGIRSTALSMSKSVQSGQHASGQARLFFNPHIMLGCDALDDDDDEEEEQEAQEEQEEEEDQEGEEEEEEEEEEEAEEEEEQEETAVEGGENAGGRGRAGQGGNGLSGRRGKPERGVRMFHYCAASEFCSMDTSDASLRTRGNLILELRTVLKPFFGLCPLSFLPVSSARSPPCMPLCFAYLLFSSLHCSGPPHIHVLSIPMTPVPERTRKHASTHTHKQTRTRARSHTQHPLQRSTFPAT